MRSLPIDLDELATAMDQRDRDTNDWYLDTQTGQVLLVMQEFMDEDDDEEEELEDDDDLPEWQQEAREEARKVRDDAADRFAWITQNDSSDSFRLMEEFIESVRDDRAKDLLSRAIDGKGAFRRFKDTLSQFPKIREQWFAFENQQQRECAAEWLESIGLQSTWQPPASRRD
jgi:hypothetical protein